MNIRRIISLIIVSLIIISSAAFSAYAAGEGGEPTVNPTEVPAASKLNPEKMGYAAYAAALDKTVFKDELGAIYTKKATSFRLWSPVATDVRVCIYKTGSDEEQGAQLISVSPMKYSEKTGVWYTTLSGDYKNHYYTYKVTVNGETSEVVDPYAKAAGVNGNRGMIVDLSETDPEGWDEDSFNRAAYATDAVVWEVSVKDFSASESSGVSEQNRGKFLAFTEPGTSLNGEGSVATCVAYLRRMGVNYVQINPFYDFASIDEADTETPQYNWGYDPKNYNVPEGSYSSNPYDGRVRIKECKQMIQALHDAGIGVIMDVVYNHTYYSEDSFLNKIVPSYYYRINEDGTWSNGSGCGNDVATERYMVRKFIRESVAYWAKEYHIDGFRFDLMGLMDVNTMNNIRVTLDSLPDGNHIIMYGEAWDLTTSAPADVKLATQSNMDQMSKRIGAFNDTARDAIKGSVFNRSETGFVQTGKSKSGVRSSIDGDGGGWATIPNQCVNYSACHDNLTLYDKLTDSVYADEGYELRREDLVSMNKLSAAIILMSRGMPFLHAGEEMCRTKLGDENSYKSDISVNQIDWNNLDKYVSVADYYRGLIKLRSAVKVFSDPTGSSTSLEYLDTEGGCIAYTVSGEGRPSVVVAFNGSPSDEASVTLPDGKWIIVADEDRAGTVKLGDAEKKIEVAPTSAVVLVDAGSYASMEKTGDEAVVYVRYKDPDGLTICEQRAGGTIGSSYELYIPDEILFNYNVTSDTSALHSAFSAPSLIAEIECEPYEGGFSSVTFKFVDQDDKPIADSIVMTNRVGQQYFSPAIPVISGYCLNLPELPENGAGMYTEDPIEVVYRFKKDDSEPAPDAESGNTCRANVIYMGNSGEILETKSYLGTYGDMLEVEELSFSGYDYISVSDNYAAFSDAEVNVIVDYMKKQSHIWVYFAVGGGVLLLILIASFFAGRKVKRGMIGAMDVEE